MADMTIAQAIQAAVAADIVGGQDKETNRRAVENWVRKSDAEVDQADLRNIELASNMIAAGSPSTIITDAVEGVLKRMVARK